MTARARTDRSHRGSRLLSLALALALALPAALPATPAQAQQRLTQHGLYDGKIDGKIGESSKSAITAYQRRSGVEEDGNASKALLDLLRRH